MLFLITDDILPRSYGHNSILYIFVSVFVSFLALICSGFEGDVWSNGKSKTMRARKLNWVQFYSCNLFAEMLIRLTTGPKNSAQPQEEQICRM